MTNIEKKVYKVVEKNIKELGYEIYDVIYVKEAKDYYLKIFIDKENGITLEDCEKVSNSISDILDEENCIQGQYLLEVSSPGIERILREDKHFEENIGKEIEVKLFKPIKNEKIISGILNSYSKEILNLKQKNEIIEIERKNIALVKTIFEW